MVTEKLQSGGGNPGKSPISLRRCMLACRVGRAGEECKWSFNFELAVDIKMLEG
jgi:hypothetical protein